MTYLNKIICGDSEEQLKKIPDETVDIIITSPPYNFNMNYDNHDDRQDWSEYFDKLDRIWKECYRVLKPGGRLCVNIIPDWKDEVPTHHMITRRIIAIGMNWKGEILWKKPGVWGTAWGSWASPSSPFFRVSWEFIEVFYKGEWKRNNNKENVDITGNEFKDWVHAFWEINPEFEMNTKYEHPAMFPEELVKRLIKLLSFKGDVVLDPFNGAGTTCVVAKRFERKYVGIDISKKYCKTARDRLKQEVLLDGKES